MEDKIYRRIMLDVMDVRRKPDGKVAIHSIKFVDKSGKLRFFPQCFVCGAGRMDNKRYRVRGVQPCDCKGNAEGHVYPVNIYSIVWFDKKEVID